jgi:hypothetical protein
LLLFSSCLQLTRWISEHDFSNRESEFTDPSPFCPLIMFQFANAVNKTAHFIRQEIGCSSMFETVLYLGYPDVRHFIALVALIKTGHKILLSSHRNSVAGHVDLAKQTDCGIMLYTSGFPVSSILDHCRMESICMPELGYLLDDTPCLLYPFDKTFEEAKDQPCECIEQVFLNFAYLFFEDTFVILT